MKIEISERNIRIAEKIVKVYNENFTPKTDVAEIINDCLIDKLHLMAWDNTENNKIINIHICENCDDLINEEEVHHAIDKHD